MSQITTVYYWRDFLSNKQEIYKKREKNMEKLFVLVNNYIEALKEDDFGLAEKRAEELLSYMDVDADI